VRVFQLLYHRYIIQLDIKILIYRFQRSPELDVVLELYGHLVVDERFEKTVGASLVSTRLDIETTG
jgi:hypothetical protein